MQVTLPPICYNLWLVESLIGSQDAQLERSNQRKTAICAGGMSASIQQLGWATAPKASVARSKEPACPSQWAEIICRPCSEERHLSKREGDQLPPTQRPAPAVRLPLHRCRCTAADAGAALLAPRRRPGRAPPLGWKIAALNAVFGSVLVQAGMRKQQKRQCASHDCRAVPSAVEDNRGNQAPWSCSRPTPYHRGRTRRVCKQRSALSEWGIPVPVPPGLAPQVT